MLAFASLQYFVTIKDVKSKLTIRHFVSMSFNTGVNKVLHLFSVAGTFCDCRQT